MCTQHRLIILIIISQFVYGTPRHHHNILFMITVHRYMCNYIHIYILYIYNILLLYIVIPIYKWIDKLKFCPPSENFPMGVLCIYY